MKPILKTIYISKVLDDEKDIILKQIENTPDDKKEQIVKETINLSKRIL